MIHRLGKEINNPESVYYWAYKVMFELVISVTWISPSSNGNLTDWMIVFQNDIPVFSPALTDGSLGDMIYFHSYKNPGLVLDIVEGESPKMWCERNLEIILQISLNLILCTSDIRRLNSKAVFAKTTGMIILGGGLVKHHVSNANLMVIMWTSKSTMISTRSK